MICWSCSETGWYISSIPLKSAHCFFMWIIRESFVNVQSVFFYIVHSIYQFYLLFATDRGLSSLTLTWLYITSMHDRHDSNGSSVYTPDFAYCGLKLSVSLDRDLRGYLPDIQIKVCFFMKRVNFLNLKSTLG